MGKAMGFGLLTIVAIYAAAAVLAVAAWLVIVVILVIGGMGSILMMFYKAAEDGKIDRWPAMLVAFVSPLGLVLLFGIISWNMGAAQKFTSEIHELEGLAGIFALLVLYLGAYGFAIIMPVFGAFAAVHAAAEKNYSACVLIGVLSVAAGFFSGGIEHMADWIEWSNGGNKSY